MKRFLLDALYGIPLAYLVTTILTLNPLVFPAAVALAVVCTAGIGLVVVIPVLWVFGRITRALVARWNGEANEDRLAPEWTPDDVAVANYVKLRHAEGVPLGTLRTELRRDGGWDEELIEAAIGQAIGLERTTVSSANGVDE